MRRAPPSVALWCLTRLVSGKRSEALLGDLLERFAEGESAAWFWRQTLMTLAFAFGREVREHGLSFVVALATASVVLFMMFRVDPLLSAKLLHFQTHQLMEWDRGWKHSFGWRITFLALEALQTGIWFAAAGWLASRIHRAHPRLIVIACAVALFVLQLPELIREIHNVMEHPRYVGAFQQYSTRLVVAIVSLVMGGLRGARRRRPNRACRAPRT